MEYVTLPLIYTAKHVPSNDSNHSAQIIATRPLLIEARHDVDICSFQHCYCPTPGTSHPFRSTIVSAVYKRQPVAASNPTRSRQLQLLLMDQTADWAINRSAHTFNAVRPVQ